MHRRLFIVCSGETTTSRSIHLQKITRLLKSLFERIIIISEDMPIVVLKRDQSWSPGKKLGLRAKTKSDNSVSRLIGFLREEARKSRLLFSHTSDGDVCLFLGIYQPIPLLIAKIRRANTVLFAGGFDVIRHTGKNRFVDTLYFFFRWAFQVRMLGMFELVILESSCVKDSYNLGRFGDKIFSDGHLFVDDQFKLIKPMSKRDIDIAFVGALSKEKGIIEFLEALLIVVESRPIKALIIGDGVLLGRIEDFLDKHGLRDLVEHKPRVSYRSMPNILGRTKLIVVPSYSEGLPNVLLEAMACGTPALATAVGAIPDVVKDHQTGFLLKSNDPQEIAQKVTELLSNTRLLRRVGGNAYRYVSRNFTYEKTLDSWREFFDKL